MIDIEAYSKDYNECIAQAQDDQRRNIRPELKCYPDNMTQEEDNSVVMINGEVLGNTQYVAQVIQENTGADKSIKSNTYRRFVMGKIVQTAGKNAFADFAPEFAHFNDDVLFGENWNNEDIDLKTRSIITVVALMSSGVTDSSLKFHLIIAKNHGVTQKEIAAIITHVAFYAGWPKGWAVFNMAKEVWEPGEGDLPYEDEAMRAHAKSMVFPIGAPNEAFAKYFVGQSYLAPVSTEQVGVFNVTFEPGCRNNWHIHHASEGGGQILVCIAGRGYYQEWGKDAILMNPGDCINIPVGVKHWHGAAPDSWFSHLAIEVPGKDSSNEWLEAVTEEQYGILK